jgi:hypothetical protein
LAALLDLFIEQLLVTRWMVQRKRSFKVRIPQKLIEDFEKAATVKRRVRRQWRPEDFGGLAFLFREKPRMSRVASGVISPEEGADTRATV